MIDESQTQECVDIWENAYMTIGRTKIKITLDGSLVYYFYVWVGDQVGQEVLLGIDFMVPAGIRLDLADGTLCLPNEVRIGLAGRKTLYRSTIQAINLYDQHVVIPVGKPTEVRICIAPPRAKLWVRRDVEWVPTVNNGPGRINYLQLTKLCYREVILRWGARLGLRMVANTVPRSQGYVSVGSRRYNEWQTLALEVTADREEVPTAAYEGPLVDQRSYPTPRKILKRQEAKAKKLANDCSVDKLQPDQNMIDEDLMHYIDESESNDRAMKSDQRSIKVLVTEHTNDETQDDERVQTMSKESSRVVTPTVTGRIDCEEPDRGQRRSIDQPDAISTMDGDGQKQSTNQSDEIARDIEERCKQPDEDDYLLTKVSSSISATQGCRRGDQSQDRHEESNPEVKMVDARDIERGISDLLQGESRCQTRRECDQRL